jgi:hypothetical protein
MIILCKITHACIINQRSSPKVLFAPPSGRTLHHSKERLKNPKSSFYIFSYGFLCSCKVNFLIPLWTLESLHKCRPKRVYPIRKIVPHGVFVAIHHVLNLWCRLRSQTLEKWRPIQDIDIVCQIHMSCDATASRIMVGPSLYHVYAPLQVVGHLSHLQCMQSMELSISRNLLTLFIAINLVVS